MSDAPKDQTPLEDWGPPGSGDPRPKADASPPADNADPPPTWIERPDQDPEDADLEADMKALDEIRGKDPTPTLTPTEFLAAGVPLAALTSEQLPGILDAARAAGVDVTLDHVPSAGPHAVVVTPHERLVLPYQYDLERGPDGHLRPGNPRGVGRLPPGRGFGSKDARAYMAGQGEPPPTTKTERVLLCLANWAYDGRAESDKRVLAAAWAWVRTRDAGTDQIYLRRLACARKRMAELGAPDPEDA